jgi:hypothetical protein
MLGHEVLLSKSSRALSNFFVFVHLISFALLGGFILSKGGRDESALQIAQNLLSCRFLDVIISTISTG